MIFRHLLPNNLIDWTSPYSAALRDFLQDKVLSYPEPLRLAKRLVGTDEPLYRFRAGDWRLVFEADLKKQQITIMTIRHRSSVYDDL